VAETGTTPWAAVTNRGRGYKNLRYLLLKAKRLSVSNLEPRLRRIGKAA
jgi:hypothetical protein